MPLDECLRYAKGYLGVHASTIRRALRRTEFRWRRTRPTLCLRDPGKNRKHYVAGALHAHTARLVWVEHECKNSTLFLKLLDAVRRHYRRARRIVLILDNYIVHNTERVAA